LGDKCTQYKISRLPYEQKQCAAVITNLELITLPEQYPILNPLLYNRNYRAQGDPKT